MNPIRFGMVGGGWRTQFYLRIAQALPHRFHVEGVVVRDAAKGRQFEVVWGVPTHRTLDELLRASTLRFVVVSVPRTQVAELLFALAERAMPTLVETPPAPDLATLTAEHELTQRGASIQVAEQYHLQPHHAARLAFVRSGKLGTVTQAHVSVAHDYHGISLLRKFLAITYENVSISARRFDSPLVAGPSRDGPPTGEHLGPSRRVIASFDFGEKLGVYDFTDQQYFSWIRTPHVLVRGERGEIHDMQVRYLQDFRTPVTLELVRQDTGQDGNLEGYYHRGILAGSEWLYRNPWIPARLSDDEIAIATCLDKMEQYAAGGVSFYSLAEASQDHYLSLLLKQALETSEVVRSTQQVWARS